MHKSIFSVHVSYIYNVHTTQRTGSVADLSMYRQRRVAPPSPLSLHLITPHYFKELLLPFLHTLLQPHVMRLLFLLPLSVSSYCCILWNKHLVSPLVLIAIRGDILIFPIPGCFFPVP